MRFRSSLGRAVAVRQAAAFAERSIRVTLRDRPSLFWSFGWPILWYGVTMYLLVLPQLPAELPAEALGMIKTTQAVTFGVFGALTVSLVGFASELSRDVDSQRYRAFRAFPLGAAADLGGRFLGSIVFGLAAFTVVLTVGLADGATIEPAYPWPLTIAVVFGSVATLCAICAAIATGIVLVTDGRSRTTVLTLSVVMVAFFGTGFNGTQPWLLPGSIAGPWLNFVPNALATRLALDALVSSGLALAQVTPPAMPDPIVGLGGLFVVVGCSTAGAIGLAQQRLYCGDVGE
ncbi:hypothetical protein [Halalkalirubrum salinum]|uniref:hypothetical protein n=1 Tax=Halalkalirubrum salinum TaxID=2563889 RepID=UPI0010FB2005|nr:hypothetical protein [Halalkalirubrum salinum]